jgi:hypothetical protein
VPEDPLDAVAVMDVHVDVGDLAGAGVPQRPDREGHVVVHAEPAGPVGHRVVQAAGEVHAVTGLAGPDGEGRGPAAAGDGRARVVHAGADGDVRVCQQAQLADQQLGELEPQGRHRMMGAEVVAEERVVPDQPQRLHATPR